MTTEQMTTKPLITADELAEMMKTEKVVLIDVRDTEQYEAGHIPGAMNIPLGELPHRLAEVPSGPVLVHCQGGTRSSIAASVLQSSGRHDVRNLAGGFAEWGARRKRNRERRGRELAQALILPTGGGSRRRRACAFLTTWSPCPPRRIEDRCRYRLVHPNVLVLFLEVRLATAQ